MGLNIVIDTNLVLYHLRNESTLRLEEYNLFTSVINEIELLSFPRITAQEELAIRRFLGFTTVVGITPSVRDNAIAIRRESAVKLPDAIVCATAKVLECPLYTADVRLERVAGIDVQIQPVSRARE